MIDDQVKAIMRIRAGKEKQLVRRHPWVFSGAIDRKTSSVPEQASIVRVENSAGNFIAYGWYDHLSHIPIRLLSWNQSIIPDNVWWTETITKAIARRSRLFSREDLSTFRLVHGEADLIPGLTVDRYHDVVVCMISARVAWEHRLLIVRTIEMTLHPAVIVVRTDASFTAIEQLKLTTEWYRQGNLVEPSQLETVVCLENHLHYIVSVGLGQKSGFFCDQRDNRARVATYAHEAMVLDACCYTGGFTLNALASGAKHVTAVDSSADALQTLSQQVELNSQKGTIPSDSPEKITLVQDDIFTFLRSVEPNSFDLIILDPPKFAQTKQQVPGALRAYKDINRLAMMAVRPGGVVASFSCSGGVSREQFHTVLAWAAKDIGREVQILETLGQPADHPVRLSFPESEYLKGYIFTVL
jgi:23S rRNA (cytosine1962-C5)-methyltransferase